jgi:hypothetical protein
VWSALEFPEILNIPELRAALTALPADALVSGARVLDAALAGALEGTDDLWTHRVKPLIVGAWPKTLVCRTAEQSTQLSALCTRLKAKFPDAVDTVLPLLGKASNLYAAMDVLASGNAPTNFPEAVVRLLDRVVDTAAQFAPEKLKKVLDRVQAADAAVAERALFRRLREFADNNSL